MTVKLLYTNGFEFSDYAIGMCYNKGGYRNEDKRNKRLQRVAIKNNHSSTIEFTDFMFEIEASTKVLLEMTRHRVGVSYAVKSSRYTLNKGEVVFEKSKDTLVNSMLDAILEIIQEALDNGLSNDDVALLLPQAYQYRWVAKFNARSLRHFLNLRTDKSAHYHIREVAAMMFEVLPEEVKFMFEDVVHSEPIPYVVDGNMIKLEGELADNTVLEFSNIDDMHFKEDDIIKVQVGSTVFHYYVTDIVGRNAHLRSLRLYNPKSEEIIDHFTPILGYKKGRYYVLKTDSGAVHIATSLDTYNAIRSQVLRSEDV